MLKVALALRASSPVLLSRATHWKVPESCRRSTAVKLRLLPWAKRRSVSWTWTPSSSQYTCMWPGASTSQRSRARRPCNASWEDGSLMKTMEPWAPVREKASSGAASWGYCLTLMPQHPKHSQKEVAEFREGLHGGTLTVGCARQHTAQV